mmetsp:Transcript_82438/g.229752  ORF Transcript_82438/g.229752 Transcript_82438/m.229752 type:complete len:262 (+) Transcript_82438:67-852(+)
MDRREEEKPVELPATSDDTVVDLLGHFSVLLEYERLQDLLPIGMHLLLGQDSLRTWYGTIFVRSGYYRGGIFRFTIYLAEDYPQTQPEVIFNSEIFHPLVNPKTGRFQWEAFLHKWQPGHDNVSRVIPHLYRVLSQESRILSNGNPANAEAFNLLQSDPKAFASRCQQCVDASLQDIYKDNPGASFQLAPRAPGVHRHLLRNARSADADARDLEDVTNEFADWFIDFYAESNNHTNADDGACKIENVAITPQGNEQVEIVE